MVTAESWGFKDDKQQDKGHPQSDCRQIPVVGVGECFVAVCDNRSPQTNQGRAEVRITSRLSRRREPRENPSQISRRSGTFKALCLWSPLSVSADNRVVCRRFHNFAEGIIAEYPSSFLESYAAETQFPFILQNLHRYFFRLAFVVLLFFWWDAILAFNLSDGFGIGIRKLVLLVKAVLISLYSLLCHSCRHLCGGKLNLFSKATLRYRSWKVVICVVGADLLGFRAVKK